MKLYKAFWNDVLMVLAVITVIVMPHLPLFNGIEVFDVYAYILISGDVGAYLMLRVFVTLQFYNAKRIGMLYELEKINRINTKEGVKP